MEVTGPRNEERKIFHFVSEYSLVLRNNCASPLFDEENGHMSKDTDEIPQPTWWQWHQLNFWMWACLENGQRYLDAHTEMMRVVRSFPSGNSTSHTEWREAYILAQNNCNLAKYNFVLSVGKTIRILTRSKKMFPEICSVCDEAVHLFQEGPELRNMIEHDEEYFEGNGRKQNEFVRQNDGGSADASSVIVTSEGHFLGGRFIVEKAIAELEVIYAVVASVPEPEVELPHI